MDDQDTAISTVAEEESRFSVAVDQEDCKGENSVVARTAFGPELLTPFYPTVDLRDGRFDVAAGNRQTRATIALGTVKLVWQFRRQRLNPFLQLSTNGHP
jgi:hypothetical protein